MEHSEVGERSQASGVIDSALAFRIWATVTGAGPFRAGTYTLRDEHGRRDAANVLKVGPPTRRPDAEVTLLLPPGLTWTRSPTGSAAPGHDRGRLPRRS